MHKVTWTCDKCGGEATTDSHSRPEPWKGLFLVDDNGNRKRIWDFCSVAHRDEFLKEKGL